MDFDRDFSPTMFGVPLRGQEMEGESSVRELGRFRGALQQHCAGIGMRLGSCMELGKGMLAKNISNLQRNRCLRESRVKVVDLRLLQSFVTGLESWRDGIQRIGEESRTNVSQLLTRIKVRRPLSSKPLFASLSTSLTDVSPLWDPKPLFQLAMSAEQVAKRLDGVPVYTVSNSANEFILISDMNSQKSLGIFCFRQEDADSLLSQVRDREPSLGRGAKVVAVSLDKVYQLKTEGIAFRFLPDPGQVKNALEAKAKPGETKKTFDGVPVFQSDNLILRSNNRRYCPIFFCKEDLERALGRAFKQQQRVNPSLKVNSDIQVGSFEDVLNRMESNVEDTGWGDIIFIPPGIDAYSYLGKARGRESVVA